MKNKKIQNKNEIQPTIKIGRFSYIIPNYTIKNYNKPGSVEIGSFCSIAQELIIFTAGEHKPQNITTFPFGAFKNPFPESIPLENCTFPSKNVIIGNDVWIGFNVTIMPGVTIHDGAIIGAKSVVASDIPPYAIAVGNPCRVIKNRFDDITIKKLLEIKWWNWPIEKIKKYARLLESENMDEFLKLADNI